VRKIGAVASALIVFTGGLVLSASSPAVAVPGGACASDEQTRAVDWQPDDWRVGAYCESLNADTKARGVGVVSSGPDHYTAYFTQLRTWRWSGWGWGAIDSHRAETTGI
jgi:hypothetical protein